MARLADIDSVYFKASVMGVSGSGKSSLGATCPRPLIAMVEKQGVGPAILRARQLGRPDPTIVLVDELQDFRDMAEAFKGPRNEPFVWKTEAGQVLCTMDPWPETIVVDSMTDAIKMLKDDLIEETDPPIGSDGLPTFSIGHWGEFVARVDRFIRWLRDAPAHVLFLSLVEERELKRDDGFSYVLTQPALGKKDFPPLLMQATNMCGLIKRFHVLEEGKPVKDKEGNLKLAIRVVTNGPNRLRVKPCTGIGDYTDPDFSAWVGAWQSAMNDMKEGN